MPRFSKDMCQMRKEEPFCIDVQLGHTRSQTSRRFKPQEGLKIEYEDHTGRNISDDPDGNNFVIDAIDLPANNEINVTKVCKKHSSFDLKIDSGAKCNVISLETIKN